MLWQKKMNRTKWEPEKSIYDYYCYPQEHTTKNGFWGKAQRAYAGKLIAVVQHSILVIIVCSGRIVDFAWSVVRCVCLCGKPASWYQPRKRIIWIGWSARFNSNRMYSLFGDVQLYLSSAFGLFVDFAGTIFFALRCASIWHIRYDIDVRCCCWCWARARRLWHIHIIYRIAVAHPPAHPCL